MAKRLFDFFSALMGLVLLSPLFLGVALLIKLEDRGPVFFRQERVGLGGKPFRVWKFRTMVVNAERLGGPLTVGADPRITRTGAFLRAAKVDELPQLINVLLGQMSLVGPRPEVPKYAALYTEEQRQVLKLRPGMTDPASIRFRNENELLASESHPERTYVEKILPEKICLNLEYARQRSLWRDIQIIFQTFLALGFGKQPEKVADRRGGFRNGGDEGLGVKSGAELKGNRSDLRLVLAPEASDVSEGSVYVRASDLETAGEGVNLDQGEDGVEYSVYSTQQFGEGFWAVAPGCGDVSEGMVWVAVKRKGGDRDTGRHREGGFE